MSDILIKNMEMPKDCLHCGFSHMASDCLKIWIICKPKDISVTDGDAVKDGRPDWCPLIEVPTPHGRLIDADALLESIKEARKKDPEIEDVYTEDYFTVAEWVVSAPTIIDAEETE